MKIKLKIIPLIGIEINDSKITFGSNINEIIKILGEPDYKNERQLYYDTLEFRMDFDNDKNLKFVELQGPETEKINPEIYGINPFEIEANELITILEEKDSDIDVSEKPYCYCFREISIGVWRDTTPENILKSIIDIEDFDPIDIMLKTLEEKNYFEMVKNIKENLNRKDIEHLEEK